MSPDAPDKDRIRGDTYLKNGDEAATANASGFAEYLGYLSLVTKIETDGFTG